MTTHDLSSDDEIFFGEKMTLKEVKKCLELRRNPTQYYSFSDDDFNETEEELSFRLIETKSEPNLLSESASSRNNEKYDNDILMKTPSLDDQYTSLIDEENYSFKASPRKATYRESVLSYSTCNDSDTSFLATEGLVIKSNLTPTKEDSLSNESEVEMVSGISLETSLSSGSECDNLETTLDCINRILEEGSKQQTTEVKKENTPKPIQTETVIKTEKKKIMSPKIFSGSFKTPLKPISVAQRTPNAFKTPTRAPNKAYMNIKSPIAYCIKNSPQIPGIQNVKPMSKLIQMPTSLPKLIPNLKRGKENFVLPTKAYLQAKSTKTIEDSIAHGLPNNNQINKMISGLSEPKIVRHQARVKTDREQSQPKPIDVNASFANLSVAQADVSVCVVKSAALH